MYRCARFFLPIFLCASTLAIFSHRCEASSDPPDRDYVSSGSALDRVERLVRVDIEEHAEVYEFTDFTIVDAGDDYVNLIVTDDEIAEVEGMGYRVTVLLEDYREASASVIAKGEYHTYDSAVAEITQTALDHSGIAHLDTIGYSVAGRPILAMRISDNPHLHENEAGIRLTGTHHGNEQISMEICLHMMKHLTDNYGTDPYVQELVDGREIWIIPMVNPDGVYLNRRQNTNWVDINRDYGYMWEGSGGSPAPFSQPETRAIRSHAQDNRFVLGFDFHSVASYVNYLWDYNPILAQDNDLIVHLADEYGDSSGLTPINGWSWYEVHGSCQDASYGLEGILDYTIETSQPGDPDPVCNNNRRAILRMIERTAEGIHGVVTDAVTGESLHAVVNVVEVGWPIYTHSEGGDYHRILLPGTYSLRVWANGYLPETVTDVVVLANDSTKVDVQLQPGGSSYAFKVVRAEAADPYNSYNNHTLTPSVLGAPDGQFLSVGVDGEIVLDMGEATPISDTTGTDFTVYEGDDGNPMEGYTVRLSNSWDGPWTLLGSGAGTQSFDISDAGFAEVRYLRIVDDGDGNPSSSYPGFDLDGVESGPITGPILVMQEYELDDSAGNDDGRFDPGETVSLYVTLANLGIDTAFQTTSVLTGGDSWVTIVDSLADFGDIAPMEEATNDADPFVLSADSLTPLHHGVHLSLLVSSDQYEETLDVDLKVGTGGDFLVWDPDPNHSSGPILKETLDSLQYDGVYTTTLLDYLDELRDFGAVFVCVGMYNTTAVIEDGSVEAESLVTYLTNWGGSMYLEGGDVWYWDPGHENGYDFGPLFGITALTDGSSDLSTILGEDGTLTREMSFTYSGENSYADRLSPDHPAYTVFTNSSPSYACGIANDAGGYKTLGFSFEFSGLTDGVSPSTKSALADSIMHFFGIRVNRSPGPFSLVFPHGDTLSPPILFDWYDSEDPDPEDTLYYSLHLSETPDVSGGIVFDSLNQSEYLLDSLPTAKSVDLWYWTVKAFDSRGGQTWSDTLTLFFESFACGDANGDDLVTVADATYLVSHIYRYGPQPLGSGDVNLDGRLTIADATYLVSYIYRGGAPPCQSPPAISH